jgi:hypothetical protein
VTSYELQALPSFSRHSSLVTRYLLYAWARLIKKVYEISPCPNFHPPSGIDSPVNVESYFQDFLPLDDHYIVDQPFFP